MVKMAECNENNYFEDNVMRITYVPIEKSLPSNENLHAGAVRTSQFALDLL